MGKMPLENPFKPVDIYYYKLVCMAFWIKWFRPKPYRSKRDRFSLGPVPHPQWPYVLAGIGAEPHGILRGISEVSLRRADIATEVGLLLVHEVEVLHPPDLYSPPSFLLWSAL